MSAYRTSDMLEPSHSILSRAGGGLRVAAPTVRPSRPAPIQAPPHPKVTVVVPLSWDVIFKRTLMSLVALRLWEGCQVLYSDGGTIYEMRNLGVEKARALGSDGVLFVDADMTFPPDALERIIAHDLPVVSGYCRKKRDPFEATAALWNPKGVYEFISPHGTGLLPVDAVGGAFLYVKMEVFDRITEPYFCNREAISEQVLDRADWLGEDFFFCQKTRRAGIPIYVDLDLRIGHLVIGEITSTDKHQPMILLQ